MVNWESSGGSVAELDEKVSHHGHVGRIATKEIEEQIAIGFAYHNKETCVSPR